MPGGDVVFVIRSLSILINLVRHETTSGGPLLKTRESMRWNLPPPQLCEVASPRVPDSCRGGDKAEAHTQSLNSRFVNGGGVICFEAWWNFVECRMKPAVCVVCQAMSLDCSQVSGKMIDWAEVNFTNEVIYTVYCLKYVHCFVVVCFVVAMWSGVAFQKHLWALKSKSY